MPIFPRSDNPTQVRYLNPREETSRLVQRSGFAIRPQDAVVVIDTADFGGDVAVQLPSLSAVGPGAVTHVFARGPFNVTVRQDPNDPPGSIAGQDTLVLSGVLLENRGFQRTTDDDPEWMIGHVGGGTGTGGESIYDAVIDPLGGADFTTIQEAFASDIALNATAANPVSFGVRSHPGAGYDIGVLAWPADVHLVGAVNNGETVFVDGEFQCLTAGRRTLQNIFLFNAAAGERCILSNHAAAVTRIESSFVQGGGAGALPTIEITLGTVTSDDCQITLNAGNANAPVQNNGGSFGLNFASAIFHADFITPAYTQTGGLCIARQSIFDGPIVCTGGTMQIHDCELRPFGPAAVDVDAPGVVSVFRGSVFSSAAPVFDGTGTLEYGDLVLVGSTAATTLFASTLTQVRDPIIDPNDKGAPFVFDDTDSPVTLTSDQNDVRTDASGGIITVNLPPTPGDGDRVRINDLGDAGTNAVTIAGNGNTINGAATLVLGADYAGALLEFQASGEWIRLSNAV